MYSVVFDLSGAELVDKVYALSCYPPSSHNDSFCKLHGEPFPHLYALANDTPQLSILWEEVVKIQIHVLSMAGVS